jgi:hypothetical protein
MDDGVREARQSFPYPVELAELVAQLRYKPGWTFTLRDDWVRDKASDGTPLSVGLTLDVVSRTYDSYHPERGEAYYVHHYWPVPPATFNRSSWERWLLKVVTAIEEHEACEFLRFGDDERRPFAPTHGPGDDPYRVVQYEDELRRRTRFTGEVVPERVGPWSG